jgi:Putative zinc-finger
MNCEAVREHLADHVLGSLPPQTDADVRAHLRGCMSCRLELRALEEGMTTFARAAHQVDPPTDLKERVLATLEEERREAPKPVRRMRLPVRRIAAVAAAVIVLGGSVGVAAVQSGRAGHYEGLAANYRNFLHTLGGKDVRVGTLHERSPQQIEGSVVMYDSDKGQSWILVLVKAAGESGHARVTVSSPTGSRIELRPIAFDPGGEGSTWLVTGSDLSRFDRVRIVDGSGTLLATGVASHQ